MLNAKSVQSTVYGTPRLEAETKRLIKSTMVGKVPDKIVKSIIPSGSRTAELYGLPKTHKPSVPLRPIVSACGDPLDKLTWLLERIITQLLVFAPAHLSNTQDYLQRISTQFPGGLPAGSIVFSVDVTNLYGNIPTGEAIAATLRLIKRHIDKIDTFGLTLSDIEKLLQHCLNNNYVRFGQKYFKQTVGVARGVRSGSLNISTRVDKREQVSTILVNISVNEAVVFTSIFQLLVVLALLGRILDADWSENDVRIGWSSVYCTMGRH